jgi:hypothetical protein
MARLRNVGFSPTSIGHILNELSTDPYPFGIAEAFDVYWIIVESKGKAIGMAGEQINIDISGYSACIQRLPLHAPKQCTDES